MKYNPYLMHNYRGQLGRAGQRGHRYSVSNREADNHTVSAAGKGLGWTRSYVSYRRILARAGNSFLYVSVAGRNNTK